MKEEIYSLIEDNKNMIYKIASKYKKFYPIEDMFQTGVIGLINAYRNFKKESNTKFSTYAYPYIFGEIINLIKNDRNIKVSSDSLKLYKSYEKTKEYLSQKLNRVPNIIEISSFMEVNPSLLEKTIIDCEFTLSLDMELDEELNLMDTIGEDKSEYLENSLLLKNEVNRLKKSEADIINLRYYKDYTQMETAKLLGLTQVQVSRSEKQILQKMRSRINS